MAKKKQDSLGNTDSAMISEQVNELEVAITNQNSTSASEQTAEKSILTQPNEEIKMEQTEKSITPKNNGGKVIALLALLIALGIGGTGYYFGTQELAKLNQQLQQFKSTVEESISTKTPNLDTEKTQITQLINDHQKTVEYINQLERNQSNYNQQINNLEYQIQQLNNAPKADNNFWLLSDADFLLNNALRKLILDNDISTTKKLLIEADNVLGQVTDLKVLSIREAIKADLNQLNTIEDVDQNSLMVRLTQLANNVDDMPMSNNDLDEEKGNTNEVSDSLNDWQTNIEKSANSFLDHFIRISDKNSTKEKEFIAPNQEVYLRENIRLRLQIAILAIPRQQDELYKQSLDVVGTWVRSYFDEKNDNVKAFLKELDNLSNQTIYIDSLKQLQSLTLLDKFLNKAPLKIEKIDIETEKSLEQVVPTEQPQTKTAEPTKSE